MIQAGYPPDQIEAYVQQYRIDEPEFFPEEAAAPRLFARLQTQWVRSPSGSQIGLVYASLEPVARILAIDLNESVLNRLQIMESHILKEMSERDRRSRAQRQVHRR